MDDRHVDPKQLIKLSLQLMDGAADVLQAQHALMMALLEAEQQPSDIEWVLSRVRKAIASNRERLESAYLKAVDVENAGRRLNHLAARALGILPSN